MDAIVSLNQSKKILSHFCLDSWRMFDSNFTTVEFIKSISIINARMLGIKTIVVQFTGKQGWCFWKFMGDFGLEGHCELNDSSRKHCNSIIMIIAITQQITNALFSNYQLIRKGRGEDKFWNEFGVQSNLNEPSRVKGSLPIPLIQLNSPCKHVYWYCCGNNFIMQNQKSWGFSTKSSSNFINSPSKQIPRHKTFKLQEVQQKQSQFLRQKNRELQDLVLRMGEQIMKLSKDKQDLLSINSKYIDTLNKQFKQNHSQFEQIKAVQRLPKNGSSSCKCKILFEFETDYRNLVKHCMNLQEQIKSKNIDLSELQNIQKQLAQANHTSVHQLIQELMDTTHELVTLKKVHNKQEFEIQKCNQKYQKMQQASKQSQKMGSNLTNEVQNYKSLINTIQNQSMDKQNYYESKIYSLQLTIQRLERDLRQQQQQSEYMTNKNNILKAQQIEYLHHNLQQKLTKTSNGRGIRSQSMQKVKKSMI